MHAPRIDVVDDDKTRRNTRNISVEFISLFFFFLKLLLCVNLSEE